MAGVTGLEPATSGLTGRRATLVSVDGYAGYGLEARRLCFWLPCFCARRCATSQRARRLWPRGTPVGARRRGRQWTYCAQERPRCPVSAMWLGGAAEARLLSGAPHAAQSRFRETRPRTEVP